MSEWQDKSDFEINKAVAWLKWKGSRVSMSDTSMPISSCEVCNDNKAVINANFDPCNNPSDAWPIIVNNEIEVRTAKGVGHAKSNTAIAIDDADITEVSSKGGALRAAMIVYLEMNGVKP